MSVVANVAINVDAANAIQQLNRVRNAAKELNGELNKTPQNAEKTKNSFKDVSSAIVGLTAKLTAGYTAAKLFADSLETFFSRSQAEQQLKNLTSGTGEYNAALALAEKQVQMFGISQTEATKAIGDVYSKLSGVGYGLKEIGEIYQGFNVIVTQTGVSSQDAAGSFFQLSQALAKGKLNGDEFVTISERMPQLLTAISQNTGIARGQFKQMAEQGQLTGELIYQALAQASQGSGDLNKYLTSQAVAMSNLKVAADRLFYVIGELFGPVVTAATQGFGDLLGKVEKAVIDNYGVFKQLLGVATTIAMAILPQMSSAFDVLAQNIKGIVVAATFFGTFVGILKAITIATQAWTAATNALATAKKVAAVAAAALQAIVNPASLIKVGLAIAGAAAASYALGKAMDEAAKQTAGVKDETKMTDAQLADLLKKYSNLPPIIDDAKDKTKQLKEEQQKVSKAIQESTQAADASAKIIGAVADQRIETTKAYLDAEKTVTQVLLEQKQTQLENAKTNNDRVKLINEIYQLTVRQAELEYQATQANIAAEIERAQLAVVTAEQKAKEVEAIVRLAAAQGSANAEHYRALEAIRDAVDLAKIQAGTVAEVATQQERAARAVLQGSLESAKAERSQALVALSTEKAAAAAGTFARNMQAAASAAGQASSNLARTTTSGGGAQIASSSNIALQQMIEKARTNVFQAIGDPISKFYEAHISALNVQGRYIREKRAQKYYQDVAELEKMGIPYTAETPDWVLRSNVYTQRQSDLSKERMDALMADSAAAKQRQMDALKNSAAAKRAASGFSPQVNITTGPVTQMDGTNYVTMSDLQQAASTAAREGANLALSQLQSNPTVRRQIGVAR